MTIFEDEEDDMHPAFEQVMSNRIEDEIGSSLFHEQRAGRSRVDFVVTDVDLDRAWKRVVSYGNTEPLPDEYFPSYDTARYNCPLPKEELIDRPAYREGGTAHDAFEWLVENNYLLEDSDGWYHFQYPPAVLGGVTVYELKLHKWQKGLSQAESYRRMIGTSGYVVIDADNTGPAIKNLDKFRDENIGLMALTRDSLEVLHEPKEDPHQVPNGSKELRMLSERSFWNLVDEHPPKDKERTPEDDIGRFQNPYKAHDTANKMDQIIDGE